MNIGVLGGTFDPVHNGHLMIAEEARNRLNLAVVLFVPAGQPQLRQSLVITPVEHRLQMLRLAIADKPYFKMSELEIERQGPSYTVDTINELSGHLGQGDELFFIMGWDSLARLPEWRDASRLLELCYLVATHRPGWSTPDLKSLEAILPGISQRVMIMDRPEIDISASNIRERVARHLSIHHLVPEVVNTYIREQGLYAGGQQGLPADSEKE
ncbi:nicotinate-nucleotide adenylyltransferase [Chloroflexota bacterium]